MKSISIATLAVTTALFLTASAHADPRLNCEPYKGNWVNSPETACPTQDIGTKPHDPMVPVVKQVVGVAVDLKS